MMKAPVGGAKHHKLLFPSAIALALATTLTSPTPAFAAGTRAGTTISNTATASFDNGSGTQTVDSNRVDLRVDELLDVTVASGNPSDVPTVPGATGQVLTFSVTNTGNGQKPLASARSPMSAATITIPSSRRSISTMATAFSTPVPTRSMRPAPTIRP